MCTFGKRIDGVHGHRSGPGTSVLVPAAIITLSQSGSTTLLNVSRSGAKLRGSKLPAVGEDALIKAGPVEAFGTIVWRHDDLCGIHFDCGLSNEELRVLELETDTARVSMLTPEELMALDDWETGFAR